MPYPNVDKVQCPLARLMLVPNCIDFFLVVVYLFCEAISVTGAIESRRLW